MNTENIAFTLSTIKPFVLGEDIETKRELQSIDAFLKKELAATKHGSERRLEILFYGLVTKLRLFTIETPEMQKLFHMFLMEMDTQITHITHESLGEIDAFGEIKKFGVIVHLKRYFNAVNRRLNILENRSISTR